MSTAGDFADEQLAAYLAAPGPVGGADVQAIRRAIAARAGGRPRGPELESVRDMSVGGRPARLYRPSTAAAGPLIVYLHGGGWTVGSIDSYDRVARRLADRSQASVLVPDYRLAPEHPWPASVDDTVAVLGDLSDLGFPAAPVAVAGDSAGGTLATLACLRLRDAGEDLPALQVLLYANTDLTGEHPSMTEKAHGYGLEADGIRSFNANWVPDRDRWADPGVSPLHAPDLAGLPAALVVTAEHDPLRDEGEAYADRLLASGVAVELRREPGLVHNFLQLDEISPACAAADRVADDIRRLLTVVHAHPV